MKKIFKLMLVMITGVFFISKSWGFAVPGKSYAYVSGHTGMTPVLTRYQIDGNGNLVNPVGMSLRFAEFDGYEKMSGIAVAPNHRYIYVAYGPGILRVRLKDSDRTLDPSDEAYYPFTANRLKYEHYGERFIAVDAHYRKLYVITRIAGDREIYSFDINASDDLVNFRDVPGSDFNSHIGEETHHGPYSSGISVANNGTIFVTTNLEPWNLDINKGHAIINRFSVGIDGNITGRIESFIDLDRGQEPGNSKYISIGNVGLLVMSDKIGGLATICLINLHQSINGCMRASEHFNHPTYDVAANPEWPNTLYFTSGSQIYRWDIDHRDRAPVSMPATHHDTREQFIVTFFN